MVKSRKLSSYATATISLIALLSLTSIAATAKSSCTRPNRVAQAPSRFARVQIALHTSESLCTDPSGVARVQIALHTSESLCTVANRVARLQIALHSPSAGVSLFNSHRQGAASL